MKPTVRALFPALLVMGLTLVPANAQEGPRNYLRSLCLKAKPGKGSELEKLYADTIAKSARHQVSQGKLARWALSRVVFPLGEVAQCDYLSGYLYNGFPPEPGLGSIQASFTAAGVGMSYEAFIAKLGDLATIVRSDLWVVRASVNAMSQGDYFAVDYMKVHSMGDWIEAETKWWKPVHEMRARDGQIKAWAAYSRALPGGTEQPYSGITVNVFPSWDSIGKQTSMGSYFPKAHQNMSAREAGERTNKARDLIRRELFKNVLYVGGN